MHKSPQQVTQWCKEASGHVKKLYYANANINSDKNI